MPLTRRKGLRRTGFKAQTPPVPSLPDSDTVQTRRRFGLRQRPWKPGASSTLAPVSHKKRGEGRMRAAAVDAVIERDGGCVWKRRIVCAKPQSDGRVFFVTLLSPYASDDYPDVPCGGAPTMHEPAHRRNANHLDPREGVCLCAVHNAWVEDHPDEARELRLLIDGNGLPLRYAHPVTEEESA